MEQTMVRVLSIVAAAGLLLAAVSDAHAQRGGTAGAFATAYGVAQREVPDGTLLKARMEGALGFYFWVDNRIVGRDQRTTRSPEEGPGDDQDISQDVLKMLQKKGRAKLPRPPAEVPPTASGHPAVRTSTPRSMALSCRSGA
jgi:hypothetical protein